MMKKHPLALLVTIFLMSQTQPLLHAANDTIRFSSKADFNNAVKLAKEKGIPLMIKFSGENWCGPCISMNNVVFSSKKWKRYAKDHHITLLVDIRNPRRIPKEIRTLAGKYNVRGVPKYIMIDPYKTRNKKRGEINRLGPVKKVDDFIRKAEVAWLCNVETYKKRFLKSLKPSAREKSKLKIANLCYYNKQLSRIIKDYRAFNRKKRRARDRKEEKECTLEMNKLDVKFDATFKNLKAVFEALQSKDLKLVKK